eukprot:880292_1
MASTMSNNRNVQRLSQLKLYDLQLETQAVITGGLLGNSDLSSCTMTIMNDIAVHHTFIDIAFARLLGLYHLFCDRYNDHVVYGKFLMVFVICVIFASISNKHKMEMSHILLQRLHINPNNPNESHPLECLFYYCLTSFFFTLTKNHLNFKYCNRNDDVVIECLLPHVSSQTDIALLIVSYTQFKWSLFITLIYECFDEINAIYHSRYKYNLFYMIQKLT